MHSIKSTVAMLTKEKSREEFQNFETIKNLNAKAIKFYHTFTVLALPVAASSAIVLLVKVYIIYHEFLDYDESDL